MKASFNQVATFKACSKSVFTSIFQLLKERYHLCDHMFVSSDNEPIYVATEGANDVRIANKQHLDPNDRSLILRRLNANQYCDFIVCGWPVEAMFRLTKIRTGNEFRNPDDEIGTMFDDLYVLNLIIPLKNAFHAFALYLDKYGYGNLIQCMKAPLGEYPNSSIIIGALGFNNNLIMLEDECWIDTNPVINNGACIIVVNHPIQGVDNMVTCFINSLSYGELYDLMDEHSFITDYVSRIRHNHCI